MCGIAGFIDFNKKSDYKILKKMIDVLYHRGPDDSGYSFYSLDNCNIGLGHRRLSILDLSSHGHQPMKFEHLEIVYNGEVYNFKEIKNELEKYGYKFDSNSDTEVILKAYHKWGIDAIHKFNGMFAIAIYDKIRNQLVLLRDRIGKKPLYYFVDSDKFIFASELKAILKFLEKKPEINNQAMVNFFRFGYIGGDLSIYKGIFKLKKSSYLILDIKSKKIEINKYNTQIAFNLDFNNYNIIKDELKKLLIDSVKIRMKSDVEFGSFLSGGIDSSLVTSIMSKISEKKIKTFTIGFKEKEFNEAIFAKEIAKYLNTEHYEYYFAEKDLIDSLEVVIANMDEPFADQSIFPTYLLSKFTKQHVTVALSGDGGDELFCGYKHYFLMQKIYNLYLLPQSIRKTIFLPLKIGNKNKLIKIYEVLTQKDISKFHHYFMKYWQDKDIALLLNQKLDNVFYYINDNNYLQNAMNFDKNNFLIDDVLVKVDRASMLASLETRAPILDYRISEFSKYVPLNFKCNKKEGKLILKDILSEFLPKNLWDRNKKGFTIPLRKWLNNELKSDLVRICSKEFIKKQNLFNYEIIDKILREHVSGKYFRTSELWSFYIFQKWWERNFG